MKYLFNFVGVYLAFLVQSLIIEKIKIFSCSPDILLATVVICAVSLGGFKAAAIGGFAGLVTDVFYGQVFGVNLLAYMYFALAVGLIVDKHTDNSPLLMGWVCFVSLTAYEIIISVLKALVGYSVSIGSVGSAVFVKGVFGALFAFFTVLVCQHVKKRRKNQIANEEESV